MHGRVDGAVNMAVDRAIQLCREEGSSPPTLRLYGWSRPTVTLGRFQELEDVDPAVCASRGVDVVRRFTGGRGVLHDDEVTYSVVASTDDGAPHGVSASYRWISAALGDAFRRLGVDAQVTAGRPSAASSACYLVSTAADLTTGGRKLSGSAQVWCGDTVLQHGSFVITRDTELESALFSLSGGDSDALNRGTAVLGELDGRMDTARICDVIVSAFEETFGIELVPGSLTLGECARIRALLDDPDRQIGLIHSG